MKGKKGTPSYLGQPVKIVSRHICLTSCWFQALQLCKFLVKDLSDRLGHLERLSTLPEFLNQLVLPVALHAEFLFDPLQLFHQIIFALALCNFTVHVTSEFTLKLCIDEFFLEDQKRFAKAVIDDETFKDILEFLHLACRDGRSEIGEFVGFVKDVGGDLIDGKVGDLVAE